MRLKLLKIGDMQKKGQVTIFVIVGLIILATFVVFLVTKTMVVTNQSDRSAVSVSSVKLFIESCLKHSAIQGISDVLSRGGYYQLHGQDVFTFTQQGGQHDVTLPYYFIQGRQELPSLDNIEREAAKSTIVFLDSCIDNFTSFKEQGYNIEVTPPQVTISFLQGKTKASLVWSGEVTKGSQTREFSMFVEDISFDFRKKYHAITSYFSQQEEAPDKFLLGRLSQIAFDNGFIFGFQQFGARGENVTLDFVYKNIDAIDPIHHKFALHFDWRGMDAPVKDGRSGTEESFKLYSVNPFVIRQPGLFYQKVEAQGNGLYFAIVPENGPSIDHRTGIVTYDPDTMENRKYLHYVTVKDNEGRSSFTPLVAEVNISR